MNDFLVVSYGGGVNSTAMLIEMVKRGIMPDLVTFADTKGEKPDTYRYVEKFARWLEPHGITIEWVCYAHDGTVDDSLEEECIRLKTLPSIAFGHRHCSLKWKQRPQEQRLKKDQRYRECLIAGNVPVRAIGIHVDEAGRANIFESGDGTVRYWYPLVEWAMGQDECEQTIIDAGLCIPPKSACFFCPAMKKAEVISLKDNEPELFARALAMEAHAEARVIKGLGRHWSWAEVGRADDEQLRLLPDVTDDRMPCQCFDG